MQTSRFLSNIKSKLTRKFRPIDPKYLDPRKLSQVAANKNLHVAAGCRAGLANRIRCYIALKALGFNRISCLPTENADDHNTGEHGIDTLFRSVVLDTSSSYDFVYRSHIIPSLEPIQSKGIVDTRVFNILNFPGLLKPELLNTANDVRDQFARLFFGLQPEHVSMNTPREDSAKTLGIHYRYWTDDRTHSAKSFLNEGAASRLWLRYNLSQIEIENFSNRVLKDLESFNLDKILVFTNSNNFFESIAGHEIEKYVSVPEVRFDGWQQALYEVLLLSHCQRIYVYPGSTFSHLSALISSSNTTISSVY